jgi:hypothetical protein
MPFSFVVSRKALCLTKVSHHSFESAREMTPGMMARGKARMGMMLPLMMLHRHLLLWMLISLRLVTPPRMASLFPLVLEAAPELTPIR